MGNTSGTYTEKAVICPLLYPYTKWGSKEMKHFMIRGLHEMPETFGIRRHEFEYLMGATEPSSIKVARSLYQEVFDTDRNGLVDKFEIMCIICMVSSVSSEDKVNFFFDLFNFNDKGYLLLSELVLLMMAVTRGVFKVDQKFLPPTLRVIQQLAQDGFHYAKVEPGHLRKPELVRFVVHNGEIASFLECWRGHASQVLIPEGLSWKDLSFPANEQSITPTSYWRKLGLPPPTFLHWRRLENVGTQMGCEFLFAHQTSFLKTIDRRVTYTGDGVLGEGFLIQGLLADGWFLNALSMMIGKPELLLNCFVSTGQETRGRYCLKFYEAGSWRTIYVDDRIPCTGLFRPAFATSSCSYESWVMLFEKALAKYVGSYGLVGLCGSRGDALLYGLRLLTGGHPFQYFVSDYEWKSNDLELLPSNKANGVDLVLDWLDEGSLVAFGKSAPASLMQQPGPGINLFPFGKLFPVVGCALTAGYLFFIFKDTWGLIHDRDIAVNVESGHSSTFQIKVEDLPQYFDTIVMVRYPDCIRTLTDKLNLPPWFTQTKASVTKSRIAPAKFILHVPIPTTSTKSTKPSSAKRRLTKVRKHKPTVDQKALIESVLAKQDEKPQDELAGIRLKDRYDFSKANAKLHGPTPGPSPNPHSENTTSATTATTAGTLDQIPEGGPGPNSTTSATAGPGKGMGEGEPTTNQVEDLVDLCLTFSSCCEWAFAGSAVAAPKIRIRIVPSKATCKAIRIRNDTLARIKQREEKKIQKRLSRMSPAIPNSGRLSSGSGLGAAILSGNRTGRLSTISGGSTPLALSNRPSVIGQRPVSQRPSDSTTTQGQQGIAESKDPSDAGAADPSNPPTSTETEEQNYDMIFTSEKSWYTKQLQLLPGKYYLLVDVEYALPYEEVRKRSLPRDITEAPWLESIIHAWIDQQKIQVDNSFHWNKFFSRNLGPDDNSDYMKALREFESKLFASLEETKREEIENHNAARRKEENPNTQDTASVSSQQASKAAEVDKIELEHRIWCEATSLQTFELTSIDENDATQAGLRQSIEEEMFGTEKKELPEQVDIERWPFLIEQQEDVTNRELINLMTTIREDADVLGEEFITIAEQYRAYRTNMLRNKSR